MTAVEPGVAAGITVPYRIRFDECTPNGLARTSALLRYAQDVAWIHSERLGFDRAWYLDRGLAWVVRAVELEVRRPIPQGVTLDISTAVSGFRKVWARRRTEARSPDGELAMWAHTDFVMTDGRGMPARVPAEFPARFASPPGGFEPGRVALPPAPPGAFTLRSSVRPQDLDPMAHVNNAAYVDYLEECLLAAADGEVPLGEVPLEAVPRNLRLEYAAPAAPGATLAGTAWREEAAEGDRTPVRWAWRLADGDGIELARGRYTGTAGTAGIQAAHESTSEEAP
jgi:acyl-CoA thioesterase FadM